MGIQQDQTVDLNERAILDWIRDETDQTVYRSPDPPLKAGFVGLHSQVMGTSPVQKFSWGVLETWSVQDLNRQHVSTFEVCVPHYQEFEVETISFVSVDDRASQDAKDALLQSFRSYNPASGVDPLEWARQALPSNEPMGFGLFDVRQKYSLKKVGRLGSDDSAADAIRNRIETGGIADGPRKYYCSRVSVSLVDELPEPSSMLEERNLPANTDLSDPAIAQAEIEQIVAAVAQPAECDALSLQRWENKVGDLLTYPEFMIRWEFVHVRIGCVEVALHLPLLYTRMSTKQLWVFGYFPRDPLAVLGKIVESCAILAAGAGVVAGLVFANLAAAIAAFKHVFLECFKSKVTTTVHCVIPGLALLTATEAWRRA